MAEVVETGKTETKAPPTEGAKPEAVKPADTAAVKPAEGPKLPNSVRGGGKPENPDFKAYLAKQEQLVRDQRALREQQEAFGKERGEYDRLKGLFTEGKTNPLKVLEAIGLTPDQFAESIAKGGPTADLLVKAVTERVAGLEQKLTEREKSEKEAETARQKMEADAEVQRYVQDVTGIIGKASEKYPHVVGLSQGGAVAQRILDHYQQTGQELGIEDAAAAVEKDLSGRFPDMVKPMLALKPMRELLKRLLAEADGAPAAKKEETPKEAVSVKKDRPTTLDNAMAGTEGGPKKDDLPEDPHDAWQAIKERRRAARR